MSSVSGFLEGRDLTLIFGSQALEFNEETAKELQSKLIDNRDFEWILATIGELPQYWLDISKAVPILQRFPGDELLQGLQQWLRTGKFPPKIPFPLPNIILTPLAVITHLTQYLESLGFSDLNTGERYPLQSAFRRQIETLGLCTGLLSAFAVSSSANGAHFQRYGGVAIRLAMAIGAVVDAQDTEKNLEGEWESFSVAWSSPGIGDKMTEILQDFPKAYVSVMLEERRVTLATPKTSAAFLQQRLKDAGLSTAKITLRGAFHSQQHRRDAEALAKFCDSHTSFQFPNASDLVFPTRSNTDGLFISDGQLHDVVVQSMLTQLSNWQKSFTQLDNGLTPEALVISFGIERYTPHWLTRKLGPRLIQGPDLTVALLNAPLSFKGESQFSQLPNHSVAVVGMSCQLPGADDLEGFWKILCAGKSQHKEAPAERFDFQTAWRDLDPNRKWYGNFIENYDTFDHKFFKKSPREMASTDPQHRLMLQAVYQAVEQSGYFARPSQDHHIGCYVGVGLVDYENNIACYPANAYAATGNLKAFTAGKISHYFGWTGPSLTIDTACSSSAVAVHQACKAILTGECSAAIAGGVNVMTSPEWFQNLAGASFLSPTGQCKPFDANADGYCRAEGVGAVFLKRLSAALNDGNPILGVIASTGVFQNQNCTAITVPNTPSLSDLFSRVLHQARLQPEQISVVEAHGTGTPIGDPAEYDSVRKVFGRSIQGRGSTLSLGSVKGLLGHTESASGIVALIKTLLMIIKGAIPPQASFQTVNPSIKASPSDNIEITTTLKPWETDLRAALINNYGASGSNASLVVTQAPAFKSEVTRMSPLDSLATKYPFWFCGSDGQSLRRYSIRFIEFLRSHKAAHDKLTLSNLSFELSRQSNRSLGQALIFSCGSVAELEEKLESFSRGEGKVAAVPRKELSRPVILCFGGQISRFIGLNREVYENVKILRHHLDQCDQVCSFLGLDSIYPEIFDKTAVNDIVKLQTMLFSVQYSCARTWIDCGVEVSAVVGHSFGELTAMCVSGILSIKDALKLIAGRARIISDYWGLDKGSMLAVEADQTDVKALLSESSQRDGNEPAANIACFNGPRSFTLAGTAKAIEMVQETIITDMVFSASIKMKRLDVTNAFHSSLVDPLIPHLKKLGEGVVFREPLIHFESATKDITTTEWTSSFLATHMRSPVYFSHAVQRLSQRHPSGVWIEAGSNSTITTMASRALGSPKSYHFQPINITSDGASQFLTDATTALWREGLTMHFWGHHIMQTSDYSLLLLPPYQFEKSRHWLELKKPLKAIQLLPEPPSIPPVPETLWTFMGYLDSKKQRVRFQVNTGVEKYKTYVSSHIVAGSAPICPSTFQLVIAIDALMSLVGGQEKAGLQPEMYGVASHAPMCMDTSKHTWLDAESKEDDNKMVWDWKITTNNGDTARSNTTLHVSGRIIIRHREDKSYQNEFARYERLVGRQRCLDLLDRGHADSVIQGSRNIYKAFAEIVQYEDEVYRGLQKIVGRNYESAGRVNKRNGGDTWLDLGLADSFCQVAGIFLNTMTDMPDGDMYISDNIDQWSRSPKTSIDSPPEVWEIYACHHRPSEKEWISDVFVFDPFHGELVEVILGIHYVRVAREGMGKLLSRLTPSSNLSHPSPQPNAAETPKTNGAHEVHPIFDNMNTQNISQRHTMAANEPIKKESPELDITGKVRDLICTLSGLEPDMIKPEADLADLGIDSLMGMELAREIEIMFKCTLEMSDLMELTDFQSLVQCIIAVLGIQVQQLAGDREADNYKTIHVNEFTHSEANGDMNGESMKVNGTHSSANDRSMPNDMVLPASVILDAFQETTQLTDHFIEQNSFANYVQHTLPGLTKLCIIHIVDGFEELGCSLRDAHPGQILNRIKYLPKHEQFVTTLYGVLEKAGLVDLDGSRITRTATAVPAESAHTLSESLALDFPEHAYDTQLTYLTGSKLADCLTGKADGLQLIFASAEGRNIVSGMYGKSPINVAWISQMQYFLKQLFARLPNQGRAPIKILEMGAGTGGTTARLVPILASLNVPFQYTVSDLSSSLVAGARKRFKEYSFMEYLVLDIEKPPPEELIHSQHLVIATNCVHATHNLNTSTRNIHDLLRRDGFLMMLEMTQTLEWIDLVFGLLEGWWLFDDGRKHALVPPSIWKTTMQSAGYGHVEWTYGNRPEAAIQRIIIALASGESRSEVHHPNQPLERLSTDFAARQTVVDDFVAKYSSGFAAPVISSQALEQGLEGHVDQCILVTGATGSLGSHLVAYFAKLPRVKRVVCVNRHSPSSDCRIRQRKALESKGLFLNSVELAKIHVLETDTSKPMMGLSDLEYTKLINSVTHIIHNAWPMSITRQIHAFEQQFKSMRNLINLARQISYRYHHLHQNRPRVGFQFISSIATVGCYSLFSGKARVPEDRMLVDSVMPTGYGEAKLVCETMLDETLHKYPQHFRPMAVRIGQITGSESSGYWNPVEHLAFLIKSSQTLNVLPDLEGNLSWCPVNVVAATLGELLLEEQTSYPVYHIENPVRQPWREMIQLLADGLHVPKTGIIPFKEWLERVRCSPSSPDDNPASNLVDFLDMHFVRMSCGGLILDTARSRENSWTLRDMGPLSTSLVMKYIQVWKERGFLKQ